MPSLRRNQRRRKRQSKKNIRRKIVGGSWLTSSSDWKLGNTLLDAGYSLPLSDIGSNVSTSSNKSTLVSFPIDNYYALPCIDYTQMQKK
jgi:hypothetical protein